MPLSCIGIKTDNTLYVCVGICECHILVFLNLVFHESVKTKMNTYMNMFKFSSPNIHAILSCSELNFEHNIIDCFFDTLKLKDLFIKYTLLILNKAGNKLMRTFHKTEC